jgi:hypothetical protein
VVPDLIISHDASQSFIFLNVYSLLCCAFTVVYFTSKYFSSAYCLLQLGCIHSFILFSSLPLVHITHSYHLQIPNTELEREKQIQTVKMHSSSLIVALALFSSALAGISHLPYLFAPLLRSREASTAS